MEFFQMLFRKEKNHMLIKFVAVLALLGVTAPVQAQAPYFQGKTIRMVVGTSAGSTYDV